MPTQQSDVTSNSAEPPFIHPNDLTYVANPSSTSFEQIVNVGLGISWTRLERINQSSDLDNFQSVPVLAGVCGDRESGYKNCSELCGRSSDMFSSWKMLWQCLALASLSLAGTSFPDLGEPYARMIHKSISEFSIGNATEFPGEIVLNHTFECAMASCETDAGDCRMEAPNSSYIVDGRVHWNIMLESLNEMCKGIEVNFNGDLAGPGVLIAYLLQMGMALYVWAFIRLPKVLQIIEVLGPTSQRLEQSNLAHATSTFLVEFHEAQCFFVTSIEIALLYARSRIDASGSTNWASLFQFIALIEIVACAGAWTILLTQISLRRARLDSTYYLTLSTTALALAFATGATTDYPSMDEVYVFFKRHNHVPQCGNNISLRTFCLTSDHLTKPRSLKSGYFTFALIGILWYEKVFELVRNGTWFRKKHRHYLEKLHVPTVIVVMFSFAAEIATIVLLFLNLTDLIKLRRELDLGEWGVGQVIAVLVWAPVISKYLYLIMFGIEKGFLYRLSRAFMVVKRPIETENEDEDEDEGDTASGDTDDADTVPLVPTHRNTSAW
ncbi:hypothetical protein CEP51_008412 [Fusarium floridanum]|uniref:Uncharacterized protein n=1 Tax=Fusarium floridanum TaxID=1325733 RepID=A0A428RKZ5_9HYPO|nr:hypothetical protein CEP51_008412 [Fusarium floridanum]